LAVQLFFLILSAFSAVRLLILFFLRVLCVLRGERFC